MQQFSYPSPQAYRLAQYRANKAKLSHLWARRGNIERIAERLLQRLPVLRLGICHGTRNGWEQSWFEEFLPGCRVTGTEIAPSAEQFPRTVRWDFHRERPDWIGAADFVYSNSLDHAHDPALALRTWLAQLAKGGTLILEWGSEHAEATESDPFGATVPELLALIAEVGGEVDLVEDAPERPARVAELRLIYVRRKA